MDTCSAPANTAPAEPEVIRSVRDRSRPGLEPAAVGCAVRAVRGVVPGRPGRVDDRRGPAGHPHRPAPEHVVLAVDRQRLRARLRWPAVAGRAGRRPAGPAPRVPGRPGPVRGGFAAGRGGQRRRAADRGPVRQGHGRGGHRARRVVPADHHVSRRPDAQPGDQHLLGLRGQRVLPRPGAVRGADRGELAVDAVAARPGRPDHAAGRDPAHPPERATPAVRAAGSTCPAVWP